MPARVSSSVQGLLPGECGIRFFTSQAFVADPIDTNRLPSASMAKGCIGWSPVIGMALKIVSGLPVGATSSGKVKTKWGKLTDDDLTAINGKREQLTGKLQNSYGIVKDQAR